MKVTVNTLAKIFTMILISLLISSYGLYILNKEVGEIATIISLVVTPIFFITSLLLLATRSKSNVE